MTKTYNAFIFPINVNCKNTYVCISLQCQANIKSFFLCMTESDQRVKLLKNQDGTPRNFTVISFSFHSYLTKYINSIIQPSKKHAITRKEILCTFPHLIPAVRILKGAQGGMYQ